MNAADLSSEIVLVTMSGCLANAKVIGAHREPGERIAFLMPFSELTEAKSMMGWRTNVFV
jgi:hypothetical protein